MSLVSDDRLLSTTYAWTSQKVPPLSAQIRIERFGTFLFMPLVVSSYLGHNLTLIYSECVYRKGRN